MRAGAEQGPLGLSCGIDPGNAVEIGAFLTRVQVSTGVSKSVYEFDPDLLCKLVENLPEVLWRADYRAASASSGSVSRPHG